MIDYLMVTMGDGWAADTLAKNIALAGVPREELSIAVFVNGPVEKHWLGLDVHILSDGTNHGFPVAANELLGSGKNYEIFLCDDDIVHQQNWMKHLRDARQAVIASGRQVGFGAVPLTEWRDERDGLGPLVDIRGIKIRPRTVPIGGTRHIDRDVIEKIGYVCEGYFPCGGDDVEYCQRAAIAGLFNYHIEAVRSVHDHHPRDAAYTQAKQEALARIAAVDKQRAIECNMGKLKWVPQREWIFQ